MDKPKIGCMERLPPETEPIQQFAWPGATARIERVAEQRMADGRHMDADLMGAAGLQPTFDHRRTLQPLDQPVTGDGAFRPLDGSDGHFLAVVRRPGMRRIDLSVRGHGVARDDWQLVVLYALAVQLGGQAL